MNLSQARTAPRSPAFLAMLCALGLLSGCATLHSGSGASTGSGAEGYSPINELLAENPMGPASANSRISSNEIVIRGVKLKNTNFDIPVTINSAVEDWVEYFNGRGRKHFEKYLERSQYFIPYMVPILRRNGMPQDLVYLSMIESGFNNHAKSHARAVGAWQFMSFTGKKYGLMVNWWVDERRDVGKSTVAAIQYLKDLHQMFGSWEMAAAAYNAGEGKMSRASQRYGTKDFWTIAKYRYLRPETRNYVPKWIAAALVAKNREQFGFAAGRQEVPAEDEAVAGDGEIVKLIRSEKPERDELDAETATLAEKTAEVSSAADDDQEEDGPDAVSAPEVVTAAVPTHGPEAPMAQPVPTPHVTRKGEVGGERLEEFEVQSPADLLKVSRAAGLSYHTVKALNPELLRWCTPPNMASYRIKLPASVKEKFLSTYNHEAYPRHVEFMTYKARRGDTLNRIARNFGIKVDPISDLNGISAHMPLRHAVKVLLPMPNDRSRSLASLEVRDPPEKRRVRRSRRKQNLYKITYKKRESARSVRSKNEGA